MSREIKFRAWDKRRKVMLFKDFWDRNWYFTPKNDKNGCHTDNNLSPDQKSYYEVMQFTGLKDKNGVEIYEGDILKYQNKILIVQWSNAALMCIDTKHIDNRFPDWHGSYTFANMGHNSFYEILGNIYENPELLKEPTQ